MLNIGCHLSASKGFVHMAQEAIEIKGNTFQFFTRNPRGSQAKEWSRTDIGQFQEMAKAAHFAPILAHAPYTLNPAAQDSSVREFAQMVFADDLKRMEALPYQMYNFHPGSHVGQGVKAGIEQIISILNQVITPIQTTRILLETMSGKGTEIGSRFEELGAIIDGVHYADKLGVCLDTCHVFSAGYDIVNHLDGVLSEFDKIIGLDRLYAIHLNDSLTPFGAHKDRHEKIGKGQIGLPALINPINHPALRDKPFYLETPQEALSGYADEIKLLKDNFNF